MEGAACHNSNNNIQLNSSASDHDVADVSILNIIIPPVHTCSFGWRSHQEHQHIKEVCDAWIVARFSNLPCDASSAVRATFTPADVLVRSGFGLLAALLYANGITHRVTQIAKFLVWGYMCDDVLDESDEMGCDPPAAEQFLASIIHVLESNADDQLAAAGASITDEQNNGLISKKAMVLLESMGDWWNELKQEMPFEQQSRFIKEYKMYSNAVRKEIHYRCACTSSLELQTYKLMRVDTFGWQLLCVLIEYSLGISFTQEILLHPLLYQLRSVAASHASWVNDILSYKKDYMKGEGLNLITVLHLHKLHEFNARNDSSGSSISCPSMQATLSDVDDIVKECDEECARLMAQIRASPQLIGEHGMESFLQAVENSLGGYTRWYLVSGRYDTNADVHA